MAYGHSGPRGQRRRAQVVVRVSSDVLDERTDHVVSGWRSRGEQTHLRLIPGPLEIHHEVPGHLAGQFRAVVLLDERKGEVQRARDAGRRVDVTVADEDGCGVHGHVRVPLGEQTGEAPVRGRTPTVQ